MLKIYNSLTRQKDEFVPMVKGKINLYVCGMTVYDFCHLGHARVLVAYDMVVRFLRHLDYDVNYVRNITDLDDKIFNRADENNEPFGQLTARYIQAMHDDSALLNIVPPTQEPRATHHINEIITLIQLLENNGFTYQAKNGTGDVYYSVRKFETYGKLSGRDIDQLLVGARVDEDGNKQDPLDFVLWKMAKPDEPYWDSPWGKGRPGWHIECSAMSKKCLGEHFDIHAGGMDLRFPHHENEIAQSEAANGCTFANYWMHNGFVNIDQEKMSKSLGNFFTVREILAQDQLQERMGEVVRYLMLASHYRSELNYSDQALQNARAALTRLYKVAQRIELITIKSLENKGNNRSENAWLDKFMLAMEDDFNTPEALAVLFDTVRYINKCLDQAQSCQLAIVAFRKISKILGIVYQSPSTFLGQIDIDHGAIIVGDLTASDIQVLLDERTIEKNLKNWSRADEIRDQLSALGIQITDTPDEPTTWIFNPV